MPPTPSHSQIFDNARLPDGSLVRITVEAGRFAALAPMQGATVVEGTQDLAAALVLPAFVEGHIHLDTSFWGDKWIPHQPCTAGFDVRERVAFQAQNIAKAAPMQDRARAQLELCLANGSTVIRSHVMVSAEVGLSHVEAVLAVREEYRGRAEVQLVAFPQSGILSSPGTGALLDAALGAGCDLIGGLDPGSFDRDIAGHLDVVFGLAEKHGCGIDVHLHDHGSLGIYQIEDIARRSRAAGMQGRVAISHAYALGEVDADTLARTAATLVAGGVAIMTNAPGSHPFPPVKPLSRAGVTVFSGSDNIRDSWWPYGDGDMLGRAMLIGYCSGFYEDAELELAFDCVTSAGAKALGLGAHGLTPGAPADFVALDAAHIPQAVVTPHRSRRVFKAGRLVAEDGKVLAP